MLISSMVQEGSLQGNKINKFSNAINFIILLIVVPNFCAAGFAFLLGESISSETDTTSPVMMSTASAPTKMTPKRWLNIE
jgi:hypothetical protein